MSMNEKALRSAMISSQNTVIRECKQVIRRLTNEHGNFKDLDIGDLSDLRYNLQRIAESGHPGRSIIKVNIEKEKKVEKKQNG